MKNIEPYLLRKMENTIDRIVNAIINAYFIALKHIIPCKVVGIDIQCPLGVNEKGEGCRDIIHTGIITDKSSFNIKEVLDCVFKSVGRHLTAKHNIKEGQIAALEFYSADKKYIIFIKDRYSV